MKYVIFTPPYHPLSGGIICLHYLCHLLNKTGHEAFIHPSFENVEFNFREKRKAVRALYKAFLTKIRRFTTNPAWETPIVYDPAELGKTDDWVAIYPEITFGNPLKAKNVARWLLHNPGHHTGKIFYGTNELYFKYSEAISDFFFHKSTTSPNILKLISYPTEFYNMHGIAQERRGTAYCIRKGRNKNIQHVLTDSVLIDNMTHEETAKIFKQVKTFICYDSLSAYSRFAALCGCDSVVIPDKEIPEESWLPNPTDRYGIAYGFENIEKARSTRHLVAEQIAIEEQRNLTQVVTFTAEVENMFASGNKSSHQSNTMS